MPRGHAILRSRFQKALGGYSTLSSAFSSSTEMCLVNRRPWDMCVQYDIARMATNSDRHANDVGDAGVVHGQASMLGCSPPKGPPRCLMRRTAWNHGFEDCGNHACKAAWPGSRVWPGLSPLGCIEILHPCSPRRNLARNPAKVHGNVAIWL